MFHAIAGRTIGTNPRLLLSRGRKARLPAGFAQLPVGHRHETLRPGHVSEGGRMKISAYIAVITVLAAAAFASAQGREDKTTPASSSDAVFTQTLAMGGMAEVAHGRL